MLIINNLSCQNGIGFKILSNIQNTKTCKPKKVKEFLPINSNIFCLFIIFEIFNIDHMPATANTIKEI